MKNKEIKEKIRKERIEIEEKARFRLTETLESFRDSEKKEKKGFLKKTLIDLRILLERVFLLIKRLVSCTDDRRLTTPKC